MPCVYVLRLEGGDKFDAYYYAGSTHQLNIRVAQHIALCGSKFTKLHKFVAIHFAELVNGDALQRENELALELMNMFCKRLCARRKILQVVNIRNVHVRSNRILCRRYT